MPRRTLLSPEQRTRLFAIPIDPAEMARHYVLSTEDLTVIRAKRRTSTGSGSPSSYASSGILAKACDLTSTRQRR
jgi:Domain of unknown function (DUF4158)